MENGDFRFGFTDEKKMNEKILIVDDDANICELLRLYLSKEGYTPLIVNDGLAAVESVATSKPALVLLDIMLPKLDGWQVCRKIRQTSDVPIIMLSAKGETFDKILGLELGADDYIVKPFEAKEVVARIKAVLRRTSPKKDADLFKIGEITLDPNSHTVTSYGKHCELTFKEYELLKLFITNPMKAYSRDQLLEIIWGIDFMGESRTVDVHIGTLRTKLFEGGAHIKTVRGVGYRMEEII